MRITFVLPGIPSRPGGGSKIVFEYANRLTKIGHDVSIYYLVDEKRGKISTIPLPKWLKHLTYIVRGNLAPRWFELEDGVSRFTIFEVNNETVANADAVFATAATTAAPVYSLSERHGIKYYLIQGYETWDMSSEDLAETYRLDMNKIVVSSWLKGIVEKDAHERVRLLTNPIDTDVFFREDCDRACNLVSVMYHDAEFKGFSDAFDALLKAKQQIPDLRVVAFGVSNRPKWLPTWFTYIKNAKAEDLRRVYSSSAAYVCATINEGFGLTCLEAMACGCPVVSTSFPGIADYAVDGCNALLSPVRNSEKLSENLIKVLKDGDLSAEMSLAGVQTASLFNWSDRIELLDSILKEV